MRSLAAAALLALLAPAAAARSERALGWSAAQIWPTAVRFLRVDERATIVDSDRDAGYIVFELADGDTRHRGALELVGGERPRVVLEIDGQPDYIEAVLLQRLERKLRAEHGAPGESTPAAP